MALQAYHLWMTTKLNDARIVSWNMLQIPCFDLPKVSFLIFFQMSLNLKKRYVITVMI